MQTPLDITFREIENSPAVLAYVKTRFQKLERFSDKIISCHIVIERDQKHQQKPIIHNVRINLTIPNYEINSDHNSDENLYKAIHLAFSRIQRQLHDTLNILEGFTKHHDAVLQGTVTRLFMDRGFGFIESSAGNEYYFSDNNITGKTSFTNMSVGATVEFIEHDGNEGLQAHRVKIKNKRG